MTHDDLTTRIRIHHYLNVPERIEIVRMLDGYRDLLKQCESRFPDLATRQGFESARLKIGGEK